LKGRTLKSIITWSEVGQQTTQLKKAHCIIYLTRPRQHGCLVTILHDVQEELVLYFDWSEKIDSTCSFDSASESHLTMRNAFLVFTLIWLDRTAPVLPEHMNRPSNENFPFYHA